AGVGLAAAVALEAVGAEDFLHVGRQGRVSSGSSDGRRAGRFGERGGSGGDPVAQDLDLLGRRPVTALGRHGGVPVLAAGDQVGLVRLAGEDDASLALVLAGGEELVVEDLELLLGPLAAVAAQAVSAQDRLGLLCLLFRRGRLGVGGEENTREDE